MHFGHIEVSRCHACSCIGALGCQMRKPWFIQAPILAARQNARAHPNRTLPNGRRHLFERTPRAKPHKLRAARQAGMSPSAAWSAPSPEEENDEPEFMDDIQRCLEIANILRGRCGEAWKAEGTPKEPTGQNKTRPIASIASTARAIARVYAAGVVGLLRVGRLADGRKLLARLT